MKAYQTYKHKDRVDRILMLSSMRDNVMLRFQKHRLTQLVWDAVNIEYERTSSIRLHQLTLKFDGHQKRQNQTMRQHFTVMSNMISELKG